MNHTEIFHYCHPQVIVSMCKSLESVHRLPGSNEKCAPTSTGTLFTWGQKPVVAAARKQNLVTYFLGIGCLA